MRTRICICVLSDFSILNKEGPAVNIFLTIPTGQPRFVLLQNMESLSSTPSHERAGPDDVELISDER